MKKLDITGQKGNSFVIMGYAKELAKQLEYTREEIVELIEDMTSYDYEHLLRVFVEHFSGIVKLVSTRDLGIDPTLCEIENNDYI